MKKISFQKAQKKFKEQGRTDIQLCEDGYVGWSKKSKFVDLETKEEFWSIPYMIFKRKSAPLRKKERFKQTNLEKYGVEYPSQSEQIRGKTKKTWLKNYGVENPNQSREIRKKIKKTNLEKYGNTCSLHGEEIKIKTKKTWLKNYGVEHPFQSKEIQEKSKQTCLERYGVECNLQLSEIKEKIKKTNLEKYGFECSLENENIKEKIKKTNLEKYGFENPWQSPLIRKKIKQTNLEKYNVEFPTQSKEIQEKIIQTMLEKYGVKHYSRNKEFKQKLSNRFIKETGEHLSEWLQNQQEPKPGYATLVHYFFNEKISLSELENYLKNYRDYKTNLEVFTENLFDIKHFNRKPEKIDLLYRPDFKLNNQIYLNVDGLYWHTEEQKGKKYHFNLRQEFENNGLQIFQFYENELLEKTNIVKSIIDNAVGKTQNKIFARKCGIKSVPHKEAEIFLNQNHLMGSTTAKHIGLYYQNELVSIISYKHKKQKTICNVERFCSKINTNVIGGFSKLLKYLENNCLELNCKEIHNWVDLRYGTGIQLLNQGFELKKETLGWRWTDCKTTYNRLKCRANMDSRKLTQQQHADELNWYKIYDAGQRLYIKVVD